MDLRSPEGGLVSIGDERAKRLLARGYTRISDETSESPATDLDTDWHTPDTQEPVQDAPALPQPQEDTTDERPPAAEVRAWAVENDVSVPAKGRVPADVYEKYAAAHQK